MLSQDEVDALLQGITGDSDVDDAAPAEASGSARTYNLADQDRIIRGRMPTMELVNERFARNIRIGIFNLIRKSPEVALNAIKLQKYSDFLREIAVRRTSHIMSVRPLRGSG